MKWMALSLVLTLVPSLVLADPDCRIGVYGDPQGEDQVFYTPAIGEVFPVYVVMRAESFVDAVALNVEYEGPGEFLMLNWQIGPTAGGLDIVTPAGHNLGLGECVVGYGGNPILVAKIDVVQIDFGTAGKGPVPYPYQVYANPDEHPLYPVYATCQGQLETCEQVETGWLYPVATGSKSWGQVKSLY